MGGGTYSNSARLSRSVSAGYHTKTREEVFTQRNLSNDMDPSGVGIRESRDSEEHPNSLPIILGLDVTGSMGDIPHNLVKEGLPHIMGNLIQNGIKDPQVLFLGIGDHECDRAPLQVGQFESSDELLDKWLTSVWIESGGGGNDGESYLLAWYFAGFHTVTDSMEKRGEKGFLFTIGDEPNLKSVPGNVLKSIMGAGQYNSSVTAAELLKKAQENYEVYHIFIEHSWRKDDGQWKQLLGDHLIVLDHHEKVASTIAKIVSTARVGKFEERTEEELIANEDQKDPSGDTEILL